MKTLMYIHGYGSNGHAVKAQKLKEMFPDEKVVANTYDYDHLSPIQILNQLKDDIRQTHPNMILGSSTGGYYALCCTQFYEGVVWCINPVRDILSTFRRVMGHIDANEALLTQRLREYELFDQEVFCRLSPRNGQLHFALSTDDELLGDHHALLQRFPQYEEVIWKEQCGHRFYRFNELHEAIALSIAEDK